MADNKPYRHIVKLTQEELNQIHTMFDELGYKFGDDGWIPTMEEVDEKLIGRYYESLRERQSLNPSAPETRKRVLALEHELRQLWLFMYWMIDTCPDMDSDVYNKLLQFVNSKYVVEG
jgi:hypothetical protein